MAPEWIPMLPEWLLILIVFIVSSLAMKTSVRLKMPEREEEK